MPTDAEQLRELDIVAVAVAERRVVLRAVDQLHVVSVGEPLPSLDGSWLRSVAPNRLSVQLPGGRTAHWYVARTGDESERIEILEPIAPVDPDPPSLPLFIPIFREPPEPETDTEDGES